MKTKIKGKNAFSIACKLTGDKVKDLALFAKLPDAEYHAANHQLLIIAKGLKIEYSKANKLPKIWEPDYTGNQWKYETRFWVKADAKRPRGVGFSNADYDHGMRMRMSALALLFLPQKWQYTSEKNLKNSIL